jgi:hypothetical protein
MISGGVALLDILHMDHLQGWHSHIYLADHFLIVENKEEDSTQTSNEFHLALNLLLQRIL